MTDRQSTLLLPNGALRYGVYDDVENLLRYEYIKPEDEPSDAGTPVNKATLLTDATESLIFGNAEDRTVNDALAKLVSAGLHPYQVLNAYYTDTAGSTPINKVIPHTLGAIPSKVRLSFLTPSTSGYATLGAFVEITYINSIFDYLIYGACQPNSTVNGTFGIWTKADAGGNIFVNYFNAAIGGGNNTLSDITITASNITLAFGQRSTGLRVTVRIEVYR